MTATPVVPAHVAIIVNGNFRWAEERGLSGLQGHKQGAVTVREFTTACRELGVKFLTPNSFSTENCSRPADEVDGLMDLLRDELPTGYRAIYKRGDDDGSIIFVVATDAPLLPHSSAMRVATMDVLSDEHIDPVFRATIEAVEEAIANAICVANDMVGVNSHAVPLDRVADLVARAR